MTRTISVVNHKGGVGKTSSVAAIGASLSSRGYDTLLVDLDSQANLTASLLPKGEEEGRTVYHALTDRRDLPIVKIREHLFLTPSSLDLAAAELILSDYEGRAEILRELLQPVLPRYSFILLDCPPSLGLIVVNALAASTDALIPLTGEALPFKGLNMIEDFIEMVTRQLNPSLSLCGIFLSRWEGRKLNKLVEELLREKYGDKTFSTRIRTNIAIAEAPLSKEDIFSYSPQSNGAKDYEALTDELLRKLQGRQGDRSGGIQ